MADEPDDADVLDEAEERLLVLLALLRHEALRSDPALAFAILRRARWERGLRHATLAVTSFTTTLGGGLALLLGLRARSGTR